MRNLQLAFRDAGVEVGPYSGRCMFGAQCPAITGSLEEIQANIGELSSHLLDNLTPENREEAKQLFDSLLKFKTDQLGLGLVFYWPDEDWEDLEENERLDKLREEGKV